MTNVQRILIIEDDDDDFFFLERAFHKLGYDGAIQRCVSSQEAMDFFAAKGKFTDRAKQPLPQLVITDLKMPESNGLRFLRWLRAHPKYMVVPTIVVASSQKASDIKEAYSLGANACMVKPATIDKLEQMLARTLTFWAHCEKPTPGVHSACDEHSGEGEGSGTG